MHFILSEMGATGEGTAEERHDLTYVLKGLLCLLLGNRLWKLGKSGHRWKQGDQVGSFCLLSVVRAGMMVAQTRVAVLCSQKGMVSGHIFFEGRVKF